MHGNAHKVVFNTAHCVSIFATGLRLEKNVKVIQAFVKAELARVSWVRIRAGMVGAQMYIRCLLARKRVAELKAIEVLRKPVTTPPTYLLRFFPVSQYFARTCPAVWSAEAWMLLHFARQSYTAGV